MKIYCTYIFFLIAIGINAQELKWYDVSEMKLEGQPTGFVTNPFQRFPDSMKNKVRDRVWELSENPAGVNLNFKTNTSEITISYVIEGEIGFPHMPPTGVSGIDLYLKDKDQNWIWSRGQYKFGDTITYNFRISSEPEKIRFYDYKLYLPLYATVKWMRIGLDKDATLEILPVIGKLPVIVYGTSITQGACAGRPGTAWTSRLSRDIERPVLNFGFSGNGRMEEEIINYISELNSNIIILDCLANFTSGQGLNSNDAKQRLLQSVKKIRKIKPLIPIILTDHAGYPHGDHLASTKNIYTNLNRANKEAYELLQKEGVKYIYILNKKELNLGMDDFVDGVHPNDAGMLKYSEAYVKKITEIFSEKE